MKINLMKKILKILSINVLVFVGLCLILEITARIGIFVIRGSSTIGLDERTNNLEYEPYVMYGHGWEKKFQNFENKNKKRILILGGSTAEAWKTDILENILKERLNIDVEVINGAHGAYNSRQQLVILSIWGGRIKPDIVISLDGANDVLHSLRGENEAGTFYLNHTYKTYLTKPYAGTLTFLIQNSQLINGISRLTRRFVEFNAEDHYDNINIYLETKKNISLISQAYEAYHISILQPYLGFKKNKTNREKAFKIYDYRDEIVKELMLFTEKKLNDLYDNSKNTYHFNSQYLYETNKLIFSDDFHFIDDYGYEILSEKIVNIIIKENLLKKNNIN